MTTATGRATQRASSSSLSSGSGPVYDPPHDLVRLLAETVDAAARTPFFGQRMGELPPIESLADFRRVPVTPIAEYRMQRLGDVVTAPSAVQWIAGAHRVRTRPSAPAAEGGKDTATRYDVVRDAILGAMRPRRPRKCVVVTDPWRRYFAAEICAVLGYQGVPAHLFVDQGNGRAWESAHLLKPDLLAVLTEDFDEDALPESVELCVTFRSRPVVRRVDRLDLYVVDELGFLAHSTDMESWVLYNDLYYFERAASGGLIATSFRSRTRPVVRLLLDDQVSELGEHTMVPAQGDFAEVP